MSEYQGKNQVLLDIKTVADKLQLPLLVVGAGARILVFDNRYNVEGRTTIDLDVAVQVNNWSDFQVLSEEMTQGSNPLFEATRVQHKFIHIATGIEIDVVPFGAIGKPNQKIQWVDGNQMNVLGLDEAFSTAELQQIEELEIKVISVTAFIVLKLIAWSDRKARKDLEDIYFILDKYDIIDILTEENQDLQGIVEHEEAAAFFVGCQIKRTFSQTVINELEQILTKILQKQNVLFPQLISLIFDQDEWDAKFYTIVAKFEALQKGIEFTSS